MGDALAQLPPTPEPVVPLRSEELALAAQVRHRSGAAQALRPLRVLSVIYRLNPADGGPPEMLRQLARNYHEIGDCFEVLTLDDPQAEYLRGLPFPVHAMGPPAQQFGVSRRLVKWLRDNAGRFDLMVMNGLWRFPSVAAWRAARRARIPYAVFPHGALDVFFRRSAPGKHAKKMVYWPLQYAILRQATAVLFTSETERVQSLAGFWPNRWTSLVLPYGTNPPPAEAEAQQEAFFARVPLLRGRRFLLFLSRIHPKKGCDLLLGAFRQLAAEYPDLDLVIAEPDPVQLQEMLQTQAAAAGLATRVHWPGMLQGAAKFGAYRAAEAFVLPSHQENFGIVVAESLACGTPVLLSDQVNIWQQIVESGTGLVEPDTEEGTTRLLTRWLMLPAEEKSAMAARTEAAFQERFSLRRTAEAIHALGELARDRRGA